MTDEESISCSGTGSVKRTKAWGSGTDPTYILVSDDTNSLRKEIVMEQREAATLVSKVSADEVLTQLRRQGINSLDDLVKKSVDKNRDPQVNASTFIYRCFIYHDDNV